jgi:hypothetical protein
MELKSHAHPVPAELVEAIRSFPLKREVEHCGIRFEVPVFDFYAQCPQCATRVKVRSFSGLTEIEDLFDAFFEWMSQPGADEIIKRRQAELREDE